MLVTPSGEYRGLTSSLSLVEGVNADGVVAGTFGYGERAFCYSGSRGLVRMESEGDGSTAMCVGADGTLGGSIFVDGVERGALFDRDEVVLVPEPARVVLALSGDGLAAGKAQRRDIFIWRRGDETISILPIEGQAVWVAGFLDSSTLILTVQEDFVRSFAAGYDGSLWRLPSLGGAICRVAAVGADGSVLLSGTNASGRLAYGVWRREFGLLPLDGSAVPGLTVESLNAIGPEGQLVGLARGGAETHLIVASPSTFHGGKAAVELS